MRSVLRRAAAPLRQVRRVRESRAWRKVQRRLTPISAQDLRDALRQVVGPPPAILMVHSSLSACGQFIAGPADVLDALREVSGTLCLPTHTYCYPARPGEPGPLFDHRATPSQNGRLTEIFRGQAGVRRSIHATHSLAACGPLADEICAGHYEADSPCGPGTPYSRLVHRRAAALMFGVTFHSYTFFHTAEFESGSPAADQRGVLDRLWILDENGRERECLSRRQNWAPNRFKEAGDWLESLGLVRRVALGRGHLLFAPDALAVHDLVVGRLTRTADLLRQSCPSPLA